MLGINKARLQVLRQLQAHPHGATTGTIAEELGIRPLTAIRHVRALEDDGVVVSDTDDRAGARVLYHVDIRQLAVLLDNLRVYAMPPTR